MTQYSMLIEWSDRDNAYLVRLPEWEAGGWVGGPVAHGATYEEAVREGKDALEALIDAAQQKGEELPGPATAVVTVKVTGA